jgi:glycosyltransferase involved in cell wall biosynthesis
MSDPGKTYSDLASAERRVLILNSHEAWVSQIDGMDQQFDIVVGLAGRAHAGWDIRMRPVPQNARLVSMNEALQQVVPYRAAIAHSVSDLMELKSLDIPKLFVIHTTLEGRLLEQHSSLTSNQIAQETAKYLKLIRAHTMAVSRLKQRSWNIPADIVGFAVRVDDYPVATQELDQGIRVSNLFNRRRIILMADFHEQAFQGIPIEFVGINDDMPGVTPAADWSDLKRRLSRSRFFVHTAEPKLEDGYNMATVEAMACALPVLGNRNPSSVIEHGITGYLSDDPKELAEYAQNLLRDRALALRMGLRAREQAAEIFARHKFETGLLKAITQARKLYYGSSPGKHPAKKKGLRGQQRRV